MTHQQKVKWAMFKFSKATDKLKRSIEAAYGVTLPEAGPSTSFEDDQNSSKFNKYEFLMMELKDKFITTQSTKVKLQILTLSPFTINETEAFFGASNYMVKMSRLLKREHGILPEMSLMSKGK